MNFERTVKRGRGRVSEAENDLIAAIIQSGRTLRRQIVYELEDAVRKSDPEIVRWDPAYKGAVMLLLIAGYTTYPPVLAHLVGTSIEWAERFVEHLQKNRVLFMGHINGKMWEESDIAFWLDVMIGLGEVERVTQEGVESKMISIGRPARGYGVFKMRRQREY